MKKAVFISLGIGIFFFSFIFFPFLIEYVNKPTATFTSEYYSPNCLLKCSQEFEYKLQQQREEEEEEKEDEKLKSSYEKQQIKDENNYENELEKYKNKLREQIKEEIKEEIREEYQKINEKKPKKTAIITMLTTETYVDGARALGWSLHASNTKSDKILLHIGNLSSKNKCLLEQAKWELRKVERIPPPNSNLISEHFNDTFTKLHTWNLKEYEKIIFLDADTIVASNFEELFEISGNFAAGSDFFYNIGETKTFNSGVMLITPDRFVFDELIVLKENLTFYDVGWTDQGLLNAYYKYKVWKVPIKYNFNLAIGLYKDDLNLWKNFFPTAKIIHYTLLKPFLQRNETEINNQKWLEIAFADALNLWNFHFNQLKENTNEEDCNYN